MLIETDEVRNGKGIANFNNYDVIESPILYESRCIYGNAYA